MARPSRVLFGLLAVSALLAGSAQASTTPSAWSRLTYDRAHPPAASALLPISLGIAWLGVESTPPRPASDHPRSVSRFGVAAKGEGALARAGRRLADERGEFTPFAGRASRLTNSQATDLAEWLGFKSTGQRLRGQTIFRDGNRYIVQDIDAHSGGTWKMANSSRALGSKNTRTGTYDEQLNYIGP